MKRASHTATLDAATVNGSMEDAKIMKRLRLGSTPSVCVMGPRGATADEYYVERGDISFAPRVHRPIQRQSVAPMSTSVSTVDLVVPFRFDSILHHVDFFKKIAFFGVVFQTVPFDVSNPTRGFVSVVTGVTHAINTSDGDIRLMNLVGPAMPHPKNMDHKCRFKLAAFTNMPSTTYGKQDFFVMRYLEPRELELFKRRLLWERTALLAPAAAAPAVPPFSKEEMAIVADILRTTPLSMICAIVEMLVGAPTGNTLRSGVIGQARSAAKPSMGLAIHAL